MALIEVKAFVNDWKYQSPDRNPSWGMKVGEPHSRKDGDAFIKTGSTSWVVKNGWDADAGKPTDFDFTSFTRGDRVLIKGVQVTEENERDGKTYKNLVIKATSIERVDATPRASIPDAWAEVSEPF